MRSCLYTESQTPPVQASQPVYVFAGEVRVSREVVQFSTVLGSCVAVCLYDIHLHIGGMNHIQMPTDLKNDDREPLRWAGPATHHLIHELLESGATRESLRAKVFGGANINAHHVPPELRIGDRNVASVLSLLREAGIRIVSRNTGGNAGRKIIFNTSTGDVWVKILGLDLRSSDQTKAPQKKKRILSC